MNNTILFSENQRFRQIWLLLILFGVNGLFLSGLVKQLIFRQQFGDKPVSDAVLIVITGIVLLISIFFLYLRLETVIKSDGVYMRFFPFHRSFKHYPWNELHQLFVRQYSPLREYGGWGIRWLGRNKALNVSCNKGIQLVTKDGSKILIGTNRSDEVVRVLKQQGHWMM